MDINEFLGYLFDYGIPLGIVLLIILVLIVAMGAAISWTRYLVFGYVCVVLLVAQTSNFGTLSGDNSNIVWVKGTKTFFFSFLDMLVFGTWLLGALIMPRWLKYADDSRSPLAKWYVAYGVLFLGYIAYAIFGSTPLLYNI